MKEHLYDWDNAARECRYPTYVHYLAESEVWRAFCEWVVTIQPCHVCDLRHQTPRDPQRPRGLAEQRFHVFHKNRKSVGSEAPWNCIVLCPRCKGQIPEDYGEPVIKEAGKLRTKFRARRKDMKRLKKAAREVRASTPTPPPVPAPAPSPAVKGKPCGGAVVRSWRDLPLTPLRPTAEHVAAFLRFNGFLADDLDNPTEKAKDDGIYDMRRDGWSVPAYEGWMAKQQRIQALREKGITLGPLRYLAAGLPPPRGGVTVRVFDEVTGAWVPIAQH